MKKFVLLIVAAALTLRVFVRDPELSQAWYDEATGNYLGGVPASSETGPEGAVEDSGRSF